MTASLPSALALLLLTAAPLLPEQLLQNGDFVETDAAGLSKSWQLVAFRDSPKPQVERVAEDGRTACRLTFAEDAPAWCVSFSQPLPQLDVEGSLVVRFAIKPQTAKPRMLSVNLSATPGCSLPCARHFLGDLRQGEWQEVEARFPLRGMKATGSVVEFIAERAFTAGDRVSLTDVHVEQEEPPPLVLRLTAPVSGVVFTDAPSQALAGIVRVSRKPAGRQVRLSLLSAATLQEPVSIQVFTASKMPVGDQCRQHFLNTRSVFGNTLEPTLCQQAGLSIVHIKKTILKRGGTEVGDQDFHGIRRIQLIGIQFAGFQ